MTVLDMTKSSASSNDWQNDVENEWKRFHDWLNQSESSLLACG